MNIRSSFRYILIVHLKASLFFFFIFSLHTNIAQAEQPQVKCRKSWGRKNLARYDFSKYSSNRIPLNDFGKNKGNFGYLDFSREVLDKVGRKKCQKDITIMVFMAANNDLAPYALWDLSEMEAAYESLDMAGSSLKLDLLVDVQTPKSPELRRLHIQQSPKRFQKNLGLDYYKMKGLEEVQSPIALYAKKREANVEEQLYGFVKWSIENYPAANYMLVVWGHGQGFTSQTFTQGQVPTFEGRFGGLAFQEGSSDFLTTPALARVLEKTSQVVLNGQDKIDVYASDACLMQMVEVAYEVAPYTEYIIGSAQIQSYLGFPYRTFINEINRGRYGFSARERNIRCGHKTNQVPCLIAHLLPEVTRRTVHIHKGVQGLADPKAFQRFTISSLESSFLRDQLIPLMDRFSKRMIAFLSHCDDDCKYRIKGALGRSLRFSGDSFEVSTSLVLLHRQLSRELENNNSPDLDRSLLKIKELSLKMLNSIRKISVASANGTFYDLYFRNRASEIQSTRLAGLSLWLPMSRDEYDERINDFYNSRLYEDLAKDPVSGKSYWELWIRSLFL